jgi:uncharacterized low-complexity protein
MLIPHRQRQAHECDHDQLLLTAVSASSSSLPVSVEGSGPPEARILAASSTAQSLSGLSIVEIERPLPVSETCNSSHEQQQAPAHSARQPAQGGCGEMRRAVIEKNETLRPGEGHCQEDCVFRTGQAVAYNFGIEIDSLYRWFHHSKCINIIITCYGNLQ